MEFGLKLTAHAEQGCEVRVDGAPAQHKSFVTFSAKASRSVQVECSGKARLLLDWHPDPTAASLLVAHEGRVVTLLTGLPDDPIASKVLLCILPPGAQGGKRGSLCFVPLAAIEKNANSPVLIPLHNLREMCEGKQSSRFQGGSEHATSATESCCFSVFYRDAKACGSTNNKEDNSETLDFITSTSATKDSFLLAIHSALTSKPANSRTSRTPAGSPSAKQATARVAARKHESPSSHLRKGESINSEGGRDVAVLSKENQDAAIELLSAGLQVKQVGIQKDKGVQWETEPLIKLAGRVGMIAKFPFLRITDICEGNQETAAPESNDNKENEDATEVDRATAKNAWDDSMCFSLMWSESALHLLADSNSSRDAWLAAFVLLLSKRPRNFVTLLPSLPLSTPTKMVVPGALNIPSPSSGSSISSQSPLRPQDQAASNASSCQVAFLSKSSRASVDLSAPAHHIKLAPPSPSAFHSTAGSPIKTISAPASSDVYREALISPNGARVRAEAEALEALAEARAMAIAQASDAEVDLLLATKLAQLPVRQASGPALDSTKREQSFQAVVARTSALEDIRHVLSEARDQACREVS